MHWQAYLVTSSSHVFHESWIYHERTRSSWPRFGAILADFCFFWIFSPLWNKGNKSCLNYIKFWEVSGNLKTSKFWKLQLSISCGTQKSAKIPRPVAKMIWTFWLIFMGFPKWPTKKNWGFQNHQFSILFCQNFRDWSLGKKDQ